MVAHRNYFYREDIMTTHHTRRIRHTSRSLAREWKLVAGRADQMGLTVPEAHALIELSTTSLSVQAVADTLLIDKSGASRALASLAKQGLVESAPDAHDKRAKNFTITPEGLRRVEAVHAEADELVSGALELLAEHEQAAVMRGLETYAKALRYRRLQEGFTFRPITEADDAAVAAIIRDVSEEYGLRAEDGYAVGDPSVDRMTSTYAAPGSRYWVLEREGRIVGCGGIAPLATDEGHYCELQKMYFLPECRGRGLGRRLVLLALSSAREYGYDACYLETTSQLGEATALYEALGFEKLARPLGSTGHDVCELHFLYRFKSPQDEA